MYNNIYNTYPEDIWVLIILELPCRIIPKLYDVSKEFEIIVIKNNLMEKRKYKGFPRKYGECLVHNVSKYSGKIYDNNELYYEGGFAGLLDKNKYKGPKLLRLVSDAVLDKLILNDVNLIKGDIISLNRDVFIFDGEKIIGNEEFVLFPDEFSINDIPRNYWCISTIFECNPVIKFNHRLMVDELINNITKCDGIISSYCYINDIPYVIIMDRFNHTKRAKCDIENFTKIILNSGCLYLYLFLNEKYTKINFEFNGIIVENIYECRGY